MTLFTSHLAAHKSAVGYNRQAGFASRVTARFTKDLNICIVEMTEELSEEVPPPPGGRQNLDISLLMQHIDRLKALLGPVIRLSGFLVESRR